MTELLSNFNGTQSSSVVSSTKQRRTMFNAPSSIEIVIQPKRTRRHTFTTDLGDLYTESGQTLQGWFTAVSKPMFATKIVLNTQFKAFSELKTIHSFALLRLSHIGFDTAANEPFEVHQNSLDPREMTAPAPSSLSPSAAGARRPSSNDGDQITANKIQNTPLLY